MQIMRVLRNEKKYHQINLLMDPNNAYNSIILSYIDKYQYSDLHVKMPYQGYLSKRSK